MKNIFIIGSSLEDKGGIVTVIKNIMNSKLKDNYRFTIIETYLTSNKLFQVFYFLKSFFVFAVKYIQLKPSLVNIHMSYKGSFYRKSFYIHLCNILKVPIVIHIHGSSFETYYKKSSKLEKKYIKIMLNKCTRIVVLSESWKSFFGNIVNEYKIDVIYNGVCVQKITSENELENRKVLQCVFLGRLGKRKGIYDLIESIKQLNDLNRVKFVLAGDGEVEKVRSIINYEGLDENIDVIGWVDDTEKETLLRNSDLLILPSYNEGLPMALLEAMSYGLPVIASNVGGIPELVQDGQNGIVIEPGNISQIVSALEKLVNNEGLRKRMATNNLEIIKTNFNSNVLMKKLGDIYEKTI